MTNKEAKEKLYMEWQKFLEDNIDYAGVSEAYKMAFKALEQEPCEDAISRQEVLYLIADDDLSMGQVVRGIHALPSVTSQEPRWIPVKFRPLTDEEKDEYPDYCYMADCPMPDDGEEILVCTMYGGVEKDECIFEDGFYLDSGYDWQTDILAWMPLPEPYKAESER